VLFDDIGDGILAQAHLAPDQAIAASLCDKRRCHRRERMGFWPLSRLAAKALAARLRPGGARADAFLNQIALEFSDTGDLIDPEAPGATTLLIGCSVYGTRLKSGWAAGREKSAKEGDPSDTAKEKNQCL